MLMLGYPERTSRTRSKERKREGETDKQGKHYIVALSPSQNSLAILKLVENKGAEGRREAAGDKGAIFAIFKTPPSQKLLSQ